ncbi:hypothetical protein GCM10011611_25390 [Aliidongia dinghuensis]|uniref:Uncharacterized protein n=1 Tax=Aliidongia dinghuensis TaxID=1867774 RepID=A0A8J2YU73_9PROT|nr:hypothetical protein GCM10011611_25390 [Aliidongia dinghuensis]
MGEPDFRQFVVAGLGQNDVCHGQVAEHEPVDLEAVPASGSCSESADGLDALSAIDTALSDKLDDALPADDVALDERRFATGSP